jgi:integrase
MDTTSVPDAAPARSAPDAAPARHGCALCDDLLPAAGLSDAAGPRGKRAPRRSCTMCGVEFRCPPPGAADGCSLAAGPAPAEFMTAVDHFLAASGLGAASQRVYRISLLGWTWPLVGQQIPRGTRRRQAAAPLVPLAVLDDPGTSARLAGALARRAAVTDARTVNRELSALRSAVAWWRDRGWILTDPTAGLPLCRDLPNSVPPLSDAQVISLRRLPASLREQAFWQLLCDSAAPAEVVLGLNAGDLDLTARRTRPGGGPPLRWQQGTGELLRRLLAGRTDGPVFLTDLRAPAATPAADVCPVTGRARMSYRRAAEIFTAATRGLDPAGRGWTLRQLRRSGRPGA